MMLYSMLILIGVNIATIVNASHSSRFCSTVLAPSADCIIMVWGLPHPQFIRLRFLLGAESFECTYTASAWTRSRAARAATAAGSRRYHCRRIGQGRCRQDHVVGEPRRGSRQDGSQGRPARR